jgi:uncharacterized Zn finger protein
MTRLSRLKPGKGVIPVYNDLYRSCPVCRTKLSEMMERVEHKTKWLVYKCKNCGSEVWIDPFKDLRKRFGK